MDGLSLQQMGDIDADAGAEQVQMHQAPQGAAESVHVNATPSQGLQVDTTTRPAPPAKRIKIEPDLEDTVSLHEPAEGQESPNHFPEAHPQDGQSHRDEVENGDEPHPLKRSASDAFSNEPSDEAEEDAFDDFTKPYDPAQEMKALPSALIWHPDFKAVEDRVLSLVRGFPEAIGECVDGDMNMLKDEAAKHDHARYPTARKIAVVGDSGLSSLINSLLNVPDLAAEGDSGTACTFVAQEFVYDARAQQGFRAEILFYSKRTRYQTLTTYFSDLYNYYAGEDADGEVSDNNEKQLSANTALEVFESLFGDRDEFGSKDAMVEYLRGAASATDPETIEQLSDWVDELLKESDCEQDVTVVEAVHLSEFKSNLRPFMTKGISGATRELQTSLWPFVRLVRISLDSQMLEQGIIIADLPGTSDTNKLRVSTARTYLNSCDMTMVVGPVKRIVTDLSTYENLKDGYRRGKSRSVIMVVTHCDEATMSSKGLLDRSRDDDNDTQELKEEHMQLEKQRKSLRQDLSKAVRPSAKVPASKISELRLRIDETQIRLQEIEKILLVERIFARNADVRKKLCAKYKEDTSDKYPLDVFCVSNKHYATHMSGYREDEAPLMNVKATGIPALREHIFGLPARRRFKAQEDHCKIVLPTFFNTVEMICSMSQTRRREQLQEVVVKAAKAIQQTLVDAFVAAKGDTIGKFVQCMGDHETPWIKASTTLCNEWNMWSAGTWSAWCRHYGAWETGTRGYEDWNKRLMEPLADALDDDFDALEDACKQFQCNLEDALQDALVSVQDNIGVESDIPPPAREMFSASLEQRKLNMTNMVEEMGEALLKDFRLRRQLFTSTVRPEDEEDSDAPPLLSAMDLMYRQCNQITGSGCTKLRRNIFQKQVTTPNGVYSTITNGARKELSEALKNQQDVFMTKIHQTFEDIRKNLRSMFTGEDNSSPEAKAMRVKLKEMIPIARAILDDEIRPMLARLKL